MHGFGGHAFLPTYAVFIAVVPVLFFNYAGEQAGTHWAAPAHFAAGQAAADELDPGDFFYPAVVLDVRAEAKEGRLG